MFRTILSALLIVSLLGVAGCQRAYFAAVNAGSAAPAQSAAYGPDPMHGLDVYRPTSAQNGPVVLFFYGGRWKGGSRADYAFVGEALAAQGLLTFVADYRQFPQVRFPDFVHDAAQATAWARAHAREFGGDPDRLFLAGHSAGAHLAAMLATDSRYLAQVGMSPRDVRGVIGIAGPYDFVPLTDPELQTIFGPESRWPDSQPVNFVDGDEPPFLLLHGDDDKLVWPRNSRRLNARLSEAGSEVTYREYAGLGHIRILSGLRSPRFAPTRADLVEFVRAN
jgi:acetyl esterase/lipase